MFHKYIDYNTNPDICLGYDDQAWFYRINTDETRKRAISKKCYFTYKGYAKAQIHKLQLKAESKPSRKPLIDKFGYDTKFAMHTLRLINQGCELLQSGKITFPRPEKNDLIKIRNGEYFSSYEEAIAFLRKAEFRLEEAYKNSFLQETPDYDYLNDLLIKIFRMKF